MPSPRELRRRADALRAEALELLDGELGEVLRELGEVEVAGSVALDLMVWRDIDLFVQLEPSEAPRLLGAVPRLAEALATQGQPVSRISYRDEHLEPDPAFPDSPGLYVALVTLGGWKIDLWGWDAARYALQRQRHRDLGEVMEGADRDLVLRLKDATRSRPDYSSLRVYEFVLSGGGTTLAQYERFRG